MAKKPKTIIPVRANHPVQGQTFEEMMAILREAGRNDFATALEREHLEEQKRVKTREEFFHDLAKSGRRIKDLSLAELLTPMAGANMPLHYIAIENKLNEVSMSIREQIPYSDKGWLSKNYRGYNPLYHAVEGGNISDIPLVILKQISFDDKGWFQEGPLGTLFGWAMSSISCADILFNADFYKPYSAQSLKNFDILWKAYVKKGGLDFENGAEVKEKAIKARKEIFSHMTLRAVQQSKGKSFKL